MTRPNEHTPTDETRAQVRAMAQFLTQNDIAQFLEISDKTLRKHYAAELEHGMVRANAKVVQNLYQFASGAKGTEKAQVTAGIFWAKTRAGFRETVDHNVQHSFVDGARDRLLGKLGGLDPEVGTQSPTASSPPIGRA
jgi:hypothetical protein